MPGPINTWNQNWEIDDGTMCRMPSRLPGPIGRNIKPIQSLDPATIWRIVHETSSEALEVLQLELDSASFEAGVFIGFAEGAWDLIKGTADFLRMIVLEGVYQRIHSPVGKWYYLASPGSRLADIAADYFLHGYVETAHREFQQLMEELRQVVSHPLDFLASVWNAEVEEYSQKWQRFKELMGDPSIAHSFSAGRIVGQTAFEVVLLLATVWDGVGLVAKGAQAIRELPELLKLVKGVGGKDAKDILESLRLKRLRRRLTSGGAASEKLSALKAEGAARRAQSFKDIDAYENTYKAQEAAARQAGNSRRAGGFKSKVTEAIGERGATEYIEKNNPDFVMDKGFKPGSGFDQVYTKYDAEGNPVETMIVEAKGPDAGLSMDAAKGPQMSKEWVKNTIQEMIESDDPATQALGTRMEAALNSGNPPLTGKVIQAIEGGGAQEVPLPSTPAYPNGGRYN